jgi:serine protease Do
MLCAGQSPPGELAPLSASLQRISRLVSPSVVKVVAVGYRQLEADESEEPGVAARQQSAGSGVILDSEGLVVTNAHVVVGANKVQVTLPIPPDTLPNPRSAVRPPGRLVRAEVVGLDLETDIALLRIPETKLPALRLADSEQVEQGQLVLAFGSPMGLDNSVSMGVVSSPARQFRTDDPMIYIQTDAPINPGNSGGPLVNIRGEVVGINTLILSLSGGSEGLGFAVPSNIVANVVEQLRRNGKVVRGEIGVLAQTITPALAAGWRLPKDWGVVVGDVEPESPAATAGVRVGDVILSLNGKTMENARQFNVQLYRPVIDHQAELVVLRGKRELTLKMAVNERHDESQFYAELASREENLIPEIGIFAVDLVEPLRSQVNPVRKTQDGVLVAARSAEGPFLEEGFRAGDIIYSLNREPVAGVAVLRAHLRKLKPGDAVAVQIERQGKLRFISFQLP